MATHECKQFLQKNHGYWCCCVFATPFKDSKIEPGVNFKCVVFLHFCRLLRDVGSELGRVGCLEGGHPSRGGATVSPGNPLIKGIPQAGIPAFGCYVLAVQGGFADRVAGDVGGALVAANVTTRLPATKNPPRGGFLYWLGR